MKLAQLLTYAVACFVGGCLVMFLGEQLGLNIYHEVAALIPATGQPWENPYQWMVTAGQAIAIGGPVLVAILALLEVTTNSSRQD